MISNSYKLYAVYDKVSGSFVHFLQSTSYGLACRTVLSSLRFPLRDTALYCLGEYSFNLDDIESVDNDFDSCFSSANFYPAPKLVPWESYKFPEDVAEALAPLNLSQSEIAEISRRKIESMVEGDK